MFNEVLGSRLDYQLHCVRITSIESLIMSSIAFTEINFRHRKKSNIFTIPIDLLCNIRKIKLLSQE